MVFLQNLDEEELKPEETANGPYGARTSITPNICSRGKIQR